MNRKKFLLSMLLVSMYPQHQAVASWLDNAQTPSLELSTRFRYQQVNDDARGDATANTFKLRLSGNWEISEQLKSFVQVDHVQGFSEQRFNSVAVTRATSPIPESLGSELNQAWVQYTSDSDWQVTAGRQLLGFDNQRHISSVEFWQNDQTYDAVKLSYDDSTKWNMTYAYINKVHRIFGDDAVTKLPEQDIRFKQGIDRPFLELGNHAHNSHLVNVNYQVNRYFGVTGYAYLLDNKTASQLSSDTFGVRFQGAVKPSTIKFGYTAELAHQQTDKNSPWDFAGFYTFAELSAQYKSHQVAIANERLSQDNGFAFATSLGNNHLFLGWADIFSSYLNTDGIRDTFLTYRGRNAKLRWRVVAHQYESDTSGDIAGRELDIEIAYRFNRDWEATLLSSRYWAKNGILGLPASQQDLNTWTLSISYNL